MTLPTQNPIPSSSKNDQLFNAEKIDQVVNSDEIQYIDRFGKKRFTFTGLYNLIQNWLASLASPSGASSVGMIQGGNLQDNVTFVSPKIYGGVPDSPLSDSLSAITTALNTDKYVDLGGKTWYISGPIYLPSGAILQNGKLVSTAVKDGGFMTGSIFAPGNYHPAWISPVVKTSCTTSNGSSVVTLTDTTSYTTGQIVRLASVDGITNGLGDFIPSYMQLARVLSKTATTLIIDSPVETSLPLVIHSANQTTVMGRFSKPLFVCSDTVVRNIEIDTWDYWTADSATFNCVFDNIYGRAKSVVYGNTFCKTLFNNINVNFRNKACELAFGSHDVIMRNVNFKPDYDWMASGSVGVSLAESGRNCVLDGFNFFSGKESVLSVIFRVSTHSGVKIRNGKINLYSNSNNILSVENEGAGRSNCDNILFENIDINVVSSAAVLCNVNKMADDSGINNVTFRNIKYSGANPSTALIRLTGTVNNPVTYVNADITTTVSGPFAISNAYNYDISFYGPVNLSNTDIASSLGKLRIINTDRINSKRVNQISSSIVDVTNTSVLTPLKSFIYPAGSLRPNDRISFTFAGSFGGLTGTKNVLLSVTGSDSQTYSFGCSATATEQGYYTITGEISFVSTVYCLIVGSVNKSGTSTPIRVLIPISELSGNQLVFNLMAWKDQTADGLSLQKTIWSLKDLTD